jgi:epoxyqueuosine reductase
VTPAALTALVKRAAQEAGFHRAGVARAHPRPDDLARLRAWLDAGMHGEMAWLAKAPERRADPGAVVPGARAVLALALDYDSAAPRTAAGLAAAEAAGDAPGWISRYAWGDDYHDLAERRLRALTAAVQAALGPALAEDFRGPDQPPGPFDARRDFRWSVDYGPVLERRWAEEAGLGWQGKHSLLVDPERGSHFFLATVFTTLPLLPDAPQTDHCGSCTRCVDACPTGAIVPGRTVDARRCISYLTIELRRPFSAEEAAAIGPHVFGCDLCQDACPFNRFSAPAGEAALAPRPGAVAPDLRALAALDEAGFRARFARSPVKRARATGLARNVLAALSNRGSRGD